MSSFPIATPEEAEKFRQELFKPFRCTEPGCKGLIGGKLVNNRLVFCGHKKDTTKLPEANAKSRPWGFKGTLKLPDHPVEQWIQLAPKEWRKLGIDEVAGGYRLVFMGSRIPLSARDMEVIGAPEFAREARDLDVLIMNGNRVEEMLAQLRK